MAEIDKPLLSEEDIRTAEKLEGDYANHPVILALNRHEIEIARFVDGYFKIKDFQPGETRTKDGYLRASSDFLIEAITAAVPYTLEPLEMVAIWSRVIKLFPDEPNDMGHYPPIHRHAVAGIISTVYAVSELGNTKWLDFPLTHLRDLELPAEVLQDRDGALRVFNRLEEIRLNIREVNRWVSIYNNPILEQLPENFGNGMTYASTLVWKLLRTE